MSKIFRLKSNFVDFSVFIEADNDDSDSIMGLSMAQRWKAFREQGPVQLELKKSDTGKKNYQFDISSFLSPFYVLSDIALDKLGDIFLPRGQILSVITDSKKKAFSGYYPTRPLSGCFDRENSLFRETERGLIIEKPVLKADKITDEYLFSIEEDISRVFVTEAFKRRVEEAGLLGFDFSVEIPTT